jgi:hypothetical protein
MNVWIIVSRTILTITATYLFLLLFWRRLKEDYTYSQILSTGFYALFGAAVGSIIADNFFSAWWFWAAFAGAFLGLSAGIWRFNLRTFETMEAAILGFLPVTTLVCLYYGLMESSIPALVSASVVFLLFVGFFILDKHYKKFTWYKSGRAGFAGFTIFGLFFLIRAAVAVFVGDMLSFVQGIEVYLSGIMAFGAFLILYNLSRE